MNHLYHTLSPLLLLASFVVLLLSFLAPVPILHERVSLLRIEVNATASAVSRRWLAQSEIPASGVVSHRMLKRSVLARAASSTKKAAASASAQAAATAHTLYFGPMGACVRTEATQSNLTCTSPSFTPIFVDLLDSIGLAPTMQAALPDQFPPAPTALFLSLLLGALTLGSALLSSAAIHGPKKLGFLAKKQVLFRKVALLCGVISLVAGLVATICLRVQLAKAVRQWNELGAGEASLWTGFPQLWAGFALEAVSVLLLVSEGLTSR